jgi:hypothetical protein
VLCFYVCVFRFIFEMQQFLNLVGKMLDQNTSKIVASYALPEPLTSNDIYFLTGEWTKIHNVIGYAAKNGSLDLIKWAHKNGGQWNKDTCKCAAAKGHLEVLRWAHENGCPWNEWTCANAAKE